MRSKARPRSTATRPRRHRARDDRSGQDSSNRGACKWGHVPRQTPAVVQTRPRATAGSGGPHCTTARRAAPGGRLRHAKLIGLNEISRSSSLRSWPAYAPRSSAWRTLAIFASPITGPRPSTSEAKAAKNAACRLRLNPCRSSKRTSIAAPSAFQVVLSAKQATAPRPCRDGPRDHRYCRVTTHFSNLADRMEGGIPIRRSPRSASRIVLPSSSICA